MTKYLIFSLFLGKDYRYFSSYGVDISELVYSFEKLFKMFKV